MGRSLILWMVGVPIPIIKTRSRLLNFLTQSSVVPALIAGNARANRSI
jgi:hypothetical protein